MTEPLAHLARKATDWRAIIRANNRKTHFVIGLFILMYFTLGGLIDLFVCAQHYPQATFSQIFYALVSLQIFPLITLIMLAVAIISLLVTISFHDKLMLLGTEYREITPTTATTSLEQQLYNVVEEMKVAAGLHYLPRVYLIEADYMNAFASGYSEKSAMIAITRGLAEKLDRSELQSVIAHELSHIRHLDIKLTLMASVLANLMVMILDIFFYHMVFSRRRDSENNRSNQALILIITLLRYLLPVINMLLLLYLSRTREYMADAGCVQLVRDSQPLASALLKINQDHHAHSQIYSSQYQQTAHENVRREAYIFDPIQAGIESTGSLTNIFSTHPSLKDRLAALGFQYENK